MYNVLNQRSVSKTGELQRSKVLYDINVPKWNHWRCVKEVVSNYVCCFKLCLLFQTMLVVSNYICCFKLFVVSNYVGCFKLCLLFQTMFVVEEMCTNWWLPPAFFSSKANSTNIPVPYCMQEPNSKPNLVLTCDIVC